MTPAEVLEAAQISDDPVVVARCLADALDQRDAWRQVIPEIEAHLALVMEGRKVRRVEVTGIGTVDLQRRTKRSGWRWDDLLRDIAKAAPEHRTLSSSSGAVESEAEAQLRILRECVSFNAGKVGGIRKYLPGDVDEYAEVAEAAPAITLRRYDR